MKVLVAVNGSKLVQERWARLVSGIDGVTSIYLENEALQVIQSIRSQRPHVVILDMHLTTGTGLDVLKNITKDHENFPKVILLVDQPFKEYQAKLAEAGADFVFNRSLEFEEAYRSLIVLVKQYSGVQGEAIKWASEEKTS